MRVYSSLEYSILLRLGVPFVSLGGRAIAARERSGQSLACSPKDDAISRGVFPYIFRYCSAS